MVDVCHIWEPLKYTKKIGEIDATDSLERTAIKVSGQQRPRRIYTRSHFAYEVLRRQTFDSWPLDYINKDELAKAGFFYNKNKDFVTCYFCKGVIGLWEKGDKPITEHLKHFPQCPFVQGTTTSNIPAITNCDGNLYSFLNEYLKSSLDLGTPVLPGNIFEKDSIRINENQKSLVFPQYENPSRRKFSYQKWPEKDTPRIEDLASAGFFYTGISDFVICYCCGGGLFNWRKSDDPLENHFHSYRDCPLFSGDDLDIRTPLPKFPDITKNQEELLLQYPFAQKLIELEFAPFVVKKALREYMERASHLPGNFQDCLETVAEWEELHQKYNQQTSVEEERRAATSKEDTKTEAEDEKN